jgi:hypothetical protein
VTHGKFFVQGWRNKDQQAEWNITSAEAADHEVRLLIHCKSGKELRLELAGAGQKLAGILPADAKRWHRVALPGTLAIPAGASTVTLRLVPADESADFDAEVHAVELIRPAVSAAQLQRAAAMRADTTWFQEAGYGIMVHWTSQSMPRKGDPKPYDQAVSDFNVEAFADQMKQTGAGLVLFTTSHAFQYFPAPLRSLDQILPGRTSKRDLVADLAGRAREARNETHALLSPRRAR